MKKWAIFHGAILVFFLVVLVATKGNIKIEADLLNMIPKSFSSKEFQKADAKMTEIVNRNVIILAKNKDFEKAKADAEKLYDELEKSGKFETISFHNDSSSVKAVTDFLFENRYNFLAPPSSEETENDWENAISQNALYKAYSPFNLTPLDFENDPFLLTEAAMENYLSALSKTGSKMSVKDGVLASEIEGAWYVMIRGILTKNASALLSKENAVVTIKNAAFSIAYGEYSSTGSPSDSTEFIFSGTPFHSYASSTSASREIAIISIVSIAAVVFMLLFVFRSPLPIFTTVLTIGLSILSGFLATLMVFKTLHVLVLIFATSLIGSCIDYSLHFFVNWKGNAELKTGAEIKSRIFGGLTLSFASTAICYATLFFAPYGILRQMAIFSITGFVSTFLTVLCVYPKLPIPSEEKRILYKPKFFDDEKRKKRFKNKKIFVALIFIFAIISIVIFKKNISIKNDVASLYTMKGKLLSDEIEAGKAIGFRIPSYFLVKGKNEDEVLMTLENLEKEINEKLKNKISIFSPTNLVPPIKKQSASKAAAEKLISRSSGQLEMLGFDEKDASLAAQNIKSDFESKKNNFVTMDNIPDFLKDATNAVWLGEIDGLFYAAAMPSVDDDALRDFSNPDGNILFLSKAKDISADLNHLTKLILKFFALSYILIFILLRFFYPTKKSLEIVSVPLEMFFVTVAIFAISKIHLEFFSITGMILVLGMGIDYIIYTVESEKHEKSFLERYAILLSFLTTELSFGILALSSFKPVHLLGLSIFIGLATAFFAANFLSRHKTLL